MQLFNFEGTWLSLYQINKIREERAKVDQQKESNDKELTRDEIKAALDEKGIEYKKNAKTDKLKELMQNNAL